MLCILFDVFFIDGEMQFQYYSRKGNKMRSNKRAVYATAIITAITLITCFAFHQTKPFIYDISLACFGSAVLGLVVAYTAYSAERRDAMEQFWDEGIALTTGIRKIKHLEFDEPIELVKNAIKEEMGIVFSDDKSKNAKEKLKSWLEENRYPDDGRLDYEEALEKYCQDILKAYLRSIIDCAQSYVDFSESGIRGLSNAYGRMDYLFANHSIRRSAYEEIYRRIYDFHKSCREEAYHFTLAINRQGNLLACLNKVLELDAKLYKQYNNMVFASFADELDKELEKFRSKIYGVSPECCEPVPIKWKLDFENPNQQKPKKNEEDRLESTAAIRL